MFQRFLNFVMDAKKVCCLLRMEMLLIHQQPCRHCTEDEHPVLNRNGNKRAKATLAQEPHGANPLKQSITRASLPDHTDSTSETLYF